MVSNLSPRGQELFILNYTINNLTTKKENKYSANLIFLLDATVDHYAI